MNSDYEPQMPPKTKTKTYNRKPRPKTTERGYGAVHQKLAKILLARYPVCSCGELAEHLHHIDHNVWNRAEDNLTTMCASCHMSYHARLRKGQ